jgi:hypothetical protein
MNDSKQEAARDVSDLLDMLGSAETFDDEGRHVFTMGVRKTAHLPRLCRVEVCGRDPRG